MPHAGVAHEAVSPEDPTFSTCIAKRPSAVAKQRAKALTVLWCILPRAVRTLTFCQLMGFPLNH